MTPSWSRSTRSVISAAPLALALLFFAGCPEKHIGRPCDLGTDNVPDPTTITINPQALECPSRICILPTQGLTTDTKPFCTDSCSNDDDCSDGEKRGSSPEDRRCNTGFACRTVIPKLANNPLSCKPVCVCKDFLSTNDATMSTKPPSCP